MFVKTSDSMYIKTKLALIPFGKYTLRQENENPNGWNLTISYDAMRDEPSYFIRNLSEKEARTITNTICASIINKDAISDISNLYTRDEE